MKAYTYDAFISYKQQSDKKTAKQLHRQLEHFHIPTEYQEKIGKKHFRIFLDKEELRVNSYLRAELKEALRNSKFLIVICSPTSKTASSVLMEIKYFMETHGNSKDNIITVLAKGEPAESIPDILIENKDTDDRVEPFAADYRRWLDRYQELRRITSTLIDCTYADLIIRNKVYELKIYSSIAGSILATAIIITILILNNINNRNNTLREESENLVFLSENAYDNYDKERAIETALQAMPSTENKRPYIPEAKRALLSATDAYKFEEDEIEVMKQFKINVPIQEYAVYTEGEGKYIAILGKDTSVHAFNIKTGEEVLYKIPEWIESGTSHDMHIIMCDENQLLACCSSEITSFNLDTQKITWEKRLDIDCSSNYVNLSYNSNSITLGLRSSEILILDKKSGRQTDYINFNKMITNTKEDQQIFAKISPDGNYIIYRNKTSINLYDRKEKTFFPVIDGLEAKYEHTDEQIMGNYYIFTCTNGKENDIRIICYDIMHKKITFEKKQKQLENNFYVPRLIPIENVKINGENMDLTLSVTGNTMLLINCQSGNVISEITFTNEIRGAFLQKNSSDFSKHDYGLLPLGYEEDVLTVIFENGECADYSFLDKHTHESYKVFESGVIYPEKTNDYFLISYKNASNEVSKDNPTYVLTNNIHTHKGEFFADSILVYGKMRTNTDWKEVTNDYDDRSNVYPYKNGFLIFQENSCIYYDIKKDSVLWENPDIHHKNDANRELLYKKGFWLNMNNTYEYLKTDASEQNIMIGNFSSDFSYQIQFLNGETGKVVKTSELNLQSYNDTPYKLEKISDFKNYHGKLFFALKLDGMNGLIISYDLSNEQYTRRKIDLKNSSSSIKISSISHNGQYIFLTEQDENTLYLNECYQAAFLDIKNNDLYVSSEDIAKNIMLVPTPCWSGDDEHFAIPANDYIVIFSNIGKQEFVIYTKEYIFVGFVFVDNILYVIGELNGTPMLYRYNVQSMEFIDNTELTGRSSFCGNTFDIECIKSFDSELIMLLRHNRLYNGLQISFSVAPFHNAYIIDQATGKSLAFVKQGAAYNPDIDYLFANQGIVKRYTTEELIERASKMIHPSVNK